MPTNCEIRPILFAHLQFKLSHVKKYFPDVKKVIYSICPWHYHELPDPEEFAREGIECEVRTLPHYDYEKYIAELAEQQYDVNTLIYVQKILPFQREAWGCV